MMNNKHRCFCTMSGWFGFFCLTIIMVGPCDGTITVSLNDRGLTTIPNHTNRTIFPVCLSHRLCLYQIVKSRNECLEESTTTLPATYALQKFEASFFFFQEGVEIIELRKNFITEIAAFAFESLVNVTELDLSHNLISNVDTNAFGGMTSLIQLLLWNNDMQTFVVVLQLQELQLTENSFSGEYHEGMFACRIHQVMARSSALCSAEFSYFVEMNVELPNLKTLSLKSNAITNITTGEAILFCCIASIQGTNKCSYTEQYFTSSVHWCV